MKKGLALSCLAFSTILAGCNAMPNAENYDSITQDDAYTKAKTSTEWMQDPALRTVYSNVGTTIKKPNGIPSSIRNKKLSIELSTNANLQDLMTAMSKELGIPSIAESSEVAATEVYLPFYEGTVGQLLNSISKSKNVAFTWEDGVLQLKPSASYMITLPQDQELMAKVVEELTVIGATDISPSVNAGVLFYSASMKNQEKIETYFDRLISNSSLITLQVMVINVNMERERKEGFDWSGFQAKLGDIGLDTAVGSDSGDSESIESDSAERFIGQAASVTGNGVGFRITRESVDIAGLFNLLSTYGNTKTTQDVSMKTISGKEVVLESNQEIPYVSDVSLSTTDTGVSNSGLETEIAKNGLSINFTPYFEADSNLVSIDIEISLQTLLGFIELSAGNQFGTITQPRTQTQSFNNKVRMPVGDTVILGGVTYESISDNRSTLSLIERSNLANQNLDITNNSLFVVIRPTVVQYKTSEDETVRSIENYDLTDMRSINEKMMDKEEE